MLLIVFWLVRDEKGLEFSFYEVPREGSEDLANTLRCVKDRQANATKMFLVQVGACVAK